MTFAIGTALGAAAAGLVGPVTWVYPTMGDIDRILKALSHHHVLGGMGSLPGAVFGGYLLGLLEAIAPVMSANYEPLFAFTSDRHSGVQTHRTIWKELSVRSFLYKYGIAALWIVIALLFHFIRDEYYLMVLTLCLIWAILASSLNLVLGFTGQATLAHGAFFGIGAYACSLLMIKMNLSFLDRHAGGHHDHRVFRVIYRSGRPADLRGLLRHLYDDVQHHRHHGHRSLGTASPKGPRGSWGFRCRPDSVWCNLNPAPLLLSVACGFLSHCFCHLSGDALHDRERPFWRCGVMRNLARAAESTIPQPRLISFTLARCWRAWAGVVFASYLGFISPDASKFLVSFTALINVVIGGNGNLIGPIMGTVSSPF